MAFTQLPTGGGVPNVDFITQTLAKLQPDSALQNYARMHKNDPYILSLATAESNRRKALRTAAQGQVGQQPTVVDQNIAGMATPVMTGSGGTLQTGYGGPVMTGMASGGLPEDQGIAQIPTPNIRTMADGGIAGYADDEEGMATGGMGGMFNFAQQSEPVVRMSGGGEVPRYQGIPKPAGDGSVVSSNPMYNVPGFQAVQPRDTFTQAGSPENMTPWERFSSYMGEKKKQATLLEIAYRIQTGIATPDEIVLYNSAKTAGGDKAATDAKYPPQDAIRTKNFPGVKPGFEKMPVDAAAAPPPPPPGAATSTGGVKDLLPAPPKLNTSFIPAAAPTADDAIAQGEKIFNSKERIVEVNRQVQQEQMDTDRAKENSIEALRAFNEKQGPAYAGYEKLLQKEELQDATDKEKSGLMSLMKGFLAMAAGESPNAATNIAKGAMVGMGDYGDALKEFKKAAKERNKEMQNIQQARRSEERGDFKEERMYTDKAETNRQASARYGLAAINDITNTSGKVNADILQNMRAITSSENIAGAREAGVNKRFTEEQIGLNARAAMGENRADARAQMPTGDARTALMLGSGNTQAERLRSGMGVLQELMSDKSGAKTVETLAKINSDRAKNGEPPISMTDLVNSAREYSALMYPKVGNDAPTRAR